MFEALKADMKNSLKEMEAETNKKLEEINKSLKNMKNNQTVETIQDLKTDIYTIKTTQTKGILETKNMGK